MKGQKRDQSSFNNFNHTFRTKHLYSLIFFSTRDTIKITSPSFRLLLRPIKECYFIDVIIVWSSSS